MINKLLAKNSVVWVISLMMAALIWLAAFVDEQPRAYTQDVTRSFLNIPIVATNIPNLLYVEHLGSDNVIGTMESVTLVGSSALISATADQDVRAYVDLHGLGEGRHTVMTWIVKPTNLQETARNPTSIEVILQAQASRELLVEIAHSGELAENTYFTGGTTIPRTVTVYGPRASVDTVDRVQAVVPVSYATSGIDQEISLTLLDATGQPVTDTRLWTEPAQVRTVQSFETVRELPLLPGEIIVPEELRFVESRLTPPLIRVAASPELLADINEIILSLLDLREADEELLTSWGLKEDDLFWQVLLKDEMLSIERGTVFSQALRLPLTLPEGVRPTEGALSTINVELLLTLEWMADSVSGVPDVEDSVHDRTYDVVSGQIYLPVSGSVYDSSNR